MTYLEFYKGRRVMITGGLGFIGSTLARQLVDLGVGEAFMDGRWRSPDLVPLLRLLIRNRHAVDRHAAGLARRVLGGLARRLRDNTRAGSRRHTLSSSATAWVATSPVVPPGCTTVAPHPSTPTTVFRSNRHPDRGSPSAAATRGQWST